MDADPEEGTESTEAKSSGYADIDNFTLNENKPLPEKDRVIYDDIQGYNNPEVCDSIRRKLTNYNWPWCTCTKWYTH